MRVKIGTDGDVFTRALRDWITVGFAAILGGVSSCSCVVTAMAGEDCACFGSVNSAS